MPRTRRWAEISHGFSGGILSPAAQDIIDSQAWLAGAARLENFNVERDGGVAGRPAFIRSGEAVIPRPKYGLLAGQTWGTNPGTGGTSTGSGITIPADLYSRPGGIVQLRPGGLRIRAVAVDTALNFFQVSLAGGRPWSFTFHGIRFISGSWLGQTGGDDRMNLVVVGHRRGNLADTVVEYRPAVPAAGTDEDPFAPGQIAPGSVKRDVVVRLDRTGDGFEADLDWIGIRLARAGAASATTPLELAIDGISCFSDHAPPDGSPASVDLGDHVFDAPYRIIPWPVRDVPFVLALGMDFVGLFQVQDGQLIRRQGDERGDRLGAYGRTWHFTERQLRELTWATFGGNLLLCHQDFPHPLEVRLPTAEQPSLNLRPLALQNVPVLPDTTIGRVAPEIAEESGAITTVQPGTTREPQQPALVTALAGVGAIAVAWPSTGADQYRVYWDTKASYDADPFAWAPRNQHDVDGLSRSYTIPSLTAGTEYAVAVASRIGTSESARSQVVFATPLSPQLAAPVVSAQDGATDGVIAFDWPDVANANRYAVQWREKTDPETEWDASTRQVVVTASAYSFNGTAGTTYELRVQSQVAAGTAEASPWSNVVEHTASLRDPRAPTSLSLARSTTADATIVVTWIRGSQADSTEVNWRISGSSAAWSTATVLATSTQSHAFEGVAGQTYEVRVRSLRTGATGSAWTGVRTLQALNLPAAAPGLLLEPLRGSQGQLRFIVTNVPRGEALTIQIQYRRGAEAFSSTRQINRAASIAGTGITSVTVLHTFTPGTVVRGRARIVRSNASASGWSPIRMATAPSGPVLAQVQGVTVRARILDTHTEFDVWWNAVPGAASYQVEAETQIGNDYPSATTVRQGTASAPWTTRELEALSRHRFRVRATALFAGSAASLITSANAGPWSAYTPLAG